MTSLRYHSSAPDPWTLPRPHRDPHLRLLHHGEIQPMTEPSRCGLQRLSMALFGLTVVAIIGVLVA